MFHVFGRFVSLLATTISHCAHSTSMATAAVTAPLAVKKDKVPEPTTIVAESGSPKTHFSLDVKFPVYALAFIDDRTVVLGGGGGSSRSGVKNRLVRCPVAMHK